jgi:hypothetical protein
VLFVGLTVAALGMLVLMLAVRRRERLVGALAALTLLPTLFATKWLGEVHVVGRGQQRVDCLIQGPVNARSDCGAAYLDRYALLMVPLTLGLVAILCFMVFQVHARVVRRPSRIPI